MDGQDTANLPATVVDNDMISWPLNGEEDGSQGNTFGELGMLPELTIFGALASAQTDGVLAAVSADSTQWTQVGRGWDQFAAIELALSEDLSEVTITAIDDASNQSEVTVSTADKSRIHLLGRRDGVTLVRLNGPSGQFFPVQGLSQSQDPPPPATTNTSATDAAFASGGVI
jgi:hypothetical protein